MAESIETRKKLEIAKNKKAKAREELIKKRQIEKEKQEAYLVYDRQGKIDHLSSITKKKFIYEDFVEEMEAEVLAGECVSIELPIEFQAFWPDGFGLTHNLYNVKIELGGSTLVPNTLVPMVKQKLNAAFIEPTSNFDSSESLIGSARGVQR